MEKLTPKTITTIGKLTALLRKAHEEHAEAVVAHLAFGNPVKDRGMMSNLAGSKVSLVTEKIVDTQAAIIRILLKNQTKTK